MKNGLIIICVLFVVLKVKSQEKDFKARVETSVVDESDKIYSLVKEKAKPIEGLVSFFKQFTKEFNYDVISENVSEVRVRLQFVVEKDGSFNNINILDDMSGVGEEAIRVLKTMPKWKPAKENNEVVRSSFVLPITLKNKNLRE